MYIGIKYVLSNMAACCEVMLNYVPDLASRSLDVVRFESACAAVPHFPVQGLQPSHVVFAVEQCGVETSRRHFPPNVSAAAKHYQK